MSCNCQCDCGCEKPESCGLECPTRPRYYAGQMLTERDLQAAIDWTRQRLRLRRLVDGWGLVCGLRVRGLNDKNLTFRVTPGYAISCCGEDVVVCDEIEVDVAKAIRPDCPALPGSTPAPQEFDVVLRPGAKRLPVDPAREIEQGVVRLVSVPVTPLVKPGNSDLRLREVLTEAVKSRLNDFQIRAEVAAVADCATCDEDDELVLGRIRVAERKIVGFQEDKLRKDYPVKPATATIGKVLPQPNPAALVFNADHITRLTITPRSQTDLPVLSQGVVVGYHPRLAVVGPDPNPGNPT